MKLFFLFLVLSLSSSIEAQDCESFDHARKAYFDGDFTGSVSTLDCLLQKNPENIDALVFLSDLYWWEADVQKSIQYAQKAQNSGKLRKTSSSSLRLQKRLKHFRLRLNYTQVQAKGRDSYEAFGMFSARYYKKNQIFYSLLRDSRLFNSGPKLSDHIHQFGHSLSAGKNVYLLNSFSFTKDPKFSPRYRYQIEPHFVWKAADYSVGFVYSDYSAVDVASLRLNFRYDFSGQLSSSLGAQFTLEPEQTVSFQNVTEFHWSDPFSNRLTLSGGRADEGDSIVTDFFFVALGFNYFFSRGLEGFLEGSLYRSDARDEDRIGAGFELSF